MNLAELNLALAQLAEDVCGDPLVALALAARLELEQIAEGVIARGTLTIATADAPTEPLAARYYYNSATKETIVTSLTGTPADLDEPKPSLIGFLLCYRGCRWEFREQRGPVIRILERLEAAGWPPFLRLDAKDAKDEEDEEEEPLSESQIRDAVKYLKIKTTGVIIWSGHVDGVSWRRATEGNSSTPVLLDWTSALRTAQAPEDQCGQ